MERNENRAIDGIVRHSLDGFDRCDHEIDVAQVHDCFSLTELLTYEDLGFCEKGSAKDHIADGDLELVDCSLAKSSFTPNFDTAIRAKQNALEDANKAVNQLAEAKERAKITRADALGEADAKIEDALGEAAKIRKSADAEAFEKRRGAEAKVKEIRGVGLADALRLAKLVQALKLNPGVVELEAIKTWKGSVPQYKINTSKGDGINLLLPTPTPHKSAPPDNESE